MKLTSALFGFVLLIFIPVSVYGVTYTSVESFVDWNDFKEQSSWCLGPAQVTRIGNTLNLKVVGVQGSHVVKLYEGSVGIKASISVTELSKRSSVGISKYIGTFGSNMVYAQIGIEKFLDYYIANFSLVLRDSHQNLGTLCYGQLGKWEGEISGQDILLSFERIEDSITFNADDFSNTWSSASKMGPAPADQASHIYVLGFEENSQIEVTVHNVSIAFPEVGDIPPSYVIKIGNNLRIPIPRTEYQDQEFQCAFDFKGGIAEDPAGLYWKLDPSSIKLK